MPQRQRAQITPFALFAMVILTGALALVVDAGIFFVTLRQIQNAADNAALAASWYDNICRPPFPVSSPAPGDGCSPAPKTCALADPTAFEADCIADQYANANLGYTGKLCSSVQFLPYNKRRGIGKVPGLSYYEMQIDCDAPYWFARVFPSIPATMHISAEAVATVGYRTANGDASNVPQPPIPGHSLLVARLVL